MRIAVLTAMLLLPIAAPALAVAQNAASSADEGRVVVRLPDPGVADDAPPSAFLAAARQAIAAGRRGAAMEAIERAESRLLVRSVRPSRAGVPSEQGLVRLLAEARTALARGDRDEAMRKLDTVMRDPALDGAVE